jgi:hypothetical protein
LVKGMINFHNHILANAIQYVKLYDLQNSNNNYRK